ncbi:amidase [Deinococcus yavapaiensis]|uniref:amidase n=1 Tax=Deinococcus yavapaiensis TaxID=309889 RepID=UPI000DA1391D|nr:amidase [Deinococcus yavapaiensis]
MNAAGDLGIWAYRPDVPLRGAPDGQLADLTFSAKDLFGVAGWPLTGSTRASLPFVEESPVVRTLIDAGATLVGKTHLHEVALGVLGTNAFGGTRNPLDAERVAGGSSGGAAASVATREVNFALGTDTGGSVRVPAAFCGVVGFKPTYGTYSARGVLPLSLTCDHVGTLSNSTEVLARVHEVLTSEQASPMSWSGVRIGVWNVENWLTPDAANALRAFEARVLALGATSKPFDFPDVMGTYSPIVLSEAAEVHREALTTESPGFLPFTLGLLRAGQALTAQEVEAAHERRDRLGRQLTDVFGAFDVLLAPAVPSVAPRVGEEELTLSTETLPYRAAILRLTAPWSLLGVPTISWPLPGPNGLSLGVQIIAPRKADALVLGLALTLERLDLERAFPESRR